MLDIHLQAYVRRDTSRRWIATCPMVGVVSQGRNAEGAQRCLQEAVELWFESCVERGVLEQALREANFRTLSSRAGSVGAEDSADEIRRRSSRDVLGERFELHLRLPAYEATLLRVSA